MSDPPIPTSHRGTVAPKRRGRWRRLGRRQLSIILASRIAVVGAAIVLFWLGLGLLSIFWTPYPPNATDFATNTPPSWLWFFGTSDSAGTDAPPRPVRAWHHLLGTDHLGRDSLSRLMAGTQVVLIKTRLPRDIALFDRWAESVTESTGDAGLFRPIVRWLDNPVLPGGVAVWGVFGSLALGTILGLNAGYRGGWTDQIVMQVLDALVAFPRIVLYLIVIATIGQGDLVVIAAITITGTPGVARLVRGLTLDLKGRDYVQAARTRGERSWYIMFVEILPNVRGPLIVDTMLRVGYAIFTIGTLGFLGIGLPPPDPDWGSMVNEARRWIFASPWPVVWPALAIASLVVGLNLLADGVQEVVSRFQR